MINTQKQIEWIERWKMSIKNGRSAIFLTKDRVNKLNELDKRISDLKANLQGV